MQGDVTTAHLGYIVRDHDAAKFAARKAQMQHIAACLNDRYGAGTVELDIKDSYYNMLEKNSAPLPSGRERPQRPSARRALNPSRPRSAAAPTARP